MSEPSAGQVLLYAVFIVIAMGALHRFEARRLPTARVRQARRGRRPPAFHDKAA